jgi:hypothetical protein
MVAACQECARAVPVLFGPSDYLQCWDVIIVDDDMSTITVDTVLRDLSSGDPWKWQSHQPTSALGSFSLVVQL